MDAFSLMSPAASMKSENDEFFDLNRLTPISDRSPSPSDSDSPCPSSPAGSKRSASEAADDGEKKPPAKKRRSWGQVLPVPTTNLPPRKRAKTEAEKEQRRVERVLRNRLAAQTSRERKRKEMEALEASKTETDKENKELKEKLDQTLKELETLRRQHKELMERISTGGSIIQMPPTPPSNPYASFSFAKSDISDVVSLSPSPTLSPQILQNDSEIVEPASTITFNTDFGMTQHPAAMLCLPSDPQCLPSQDGTSTLAWISTILLSWITLVSTLVLSPLTTKRSAVLSSTWNLLASMTSLTLVPFLRSLSLDTHPRIATGQVMRTQHRSNEGVLDNKKYVSEGKNYRSVIVIRSGDTGWDQTKKGNGHHEKGLGRHSSSSPWSLLGGGGDRRTQVGWRTRIF